jgi:hypothetical protein
MDYATLNQIADSPDVGEQERYMAELLVGACTDWPVRDLKEPNDLLGELRRETAGPLTYARLNAYADHLRPETDTWKLEAMVSVLEFFRVALSLGLSDVSELDDAVSLLGASYEQRMAQPNSSLNSGPSGGLA